MLMCAILVVMMVLICGIVFWLGSIMIWLICFLVC